MTAIIVEDERPAWEKLTRALQEVAPGIEIRSVLTSTEQALEYFRQQGFPNIVFMDIELSDGPSFRIFEAMKIECPVIFTTAYDEYWQQAFEQNGIDYLLKPIRKERLAAALQKYRHLQQYYRKDVLPLFTPLADKKFAVKKGAAFLHYRFDQIAYFFATRKLVFLVSTDGKKTLVQQTLTELEEQLDRRFFQRINRKFIVHQDAIRKVRTLPKSKLALELDPSPNEQVTISHENAARFRRWMQGE